MDAGWVRMWALAMAALGLACVLVGCSQFGGGRPAPGSPPRAALEQLLAEVTVVPRRPHPGGYDRGCLAGQGCVFGPAWTEGPFADPRGPDAEGPDNGGRGGCDTRNSVLGKQLSQVRFRAGSHDCMVLSGILDDPYTGQRIQFDRARPRAVQIDHVYPLAAAWDMGASQWPLQRRVRFANDIDVNLLAVDGDANKDKRDQTPSDWLPPARAYRCFYAGKYLLAATRYALPITAADQDILRVVVRSCP